MEPITIICDTRENKPYTFEAFRVETKTKTMATGDYAAVQHCDVDENDTYHPRAAVERKAGDDFVRSLTVDYSRFREECERADDWNQPLAILVEEPWQTFEHGRKFFNHTGVTPNQLQGIMGGLSRECNISFSFVGNRTIGERATFERIQEWVNRDDL